MRDLRQQLLGPRVIRVERKRLAEVVGGARPVSGSEKQLGEHFVLGRRSQIGPPEARALLE